MIDAITRCVRQAGEIGASLIVVEAKNEKARDFYERHGFLSLPSTPKRLVLAMNTAAMVMGDI